MPATSSPSCCRYWTAAPTSCIAWHEWTRCSAIAARPQRAGDFRRHETAVCRPAGRTLVRRSAGTAEFTDIVARFMPHARLVSDQPPGADATRKRLWSARNRLRPAADCFYVSSVRHGKILRMARNGTSSEFLREGGADYLGRPGARHRLQAPISLGHHRRDARESDLTNRRIAAVPRRRRFLSGCALLKRYDLPRDTEHALGDLTVSPAGDVSVSDGHGPVYWVAHDDDRLRTLIPSGHLPALRKRPHSARRQDALCADYTRGISAVDLRTRERRLVPHPPELSRGHRRAVSRGPQLDRRAERDTAGPNHSHAARFLAARIEGFDVLESNSPELGAPTHGVVVGDRFYFLANSGWDRLSDDGQVNPASTFRGARRFAN